MSTNRFGSHPVVRYGLAVSLVAIAVAETARLSVTGWHNFSLLFAAVVVASAVGGFGPGLVATAIGAVAFTVVVPEPFGVVATRPEQLAATVAFALVSVLISWIGGELRKQRLRAAVVLAQRDSILRSMKTGLVALGMPSGKLLFHNPAAAELLGSALQEDAAPCCPFVGPDGAPIPGDDSPFGLAVRNGGHLRPTKFALPGRDGTRRILEFCATPVRSQRAEVRSTVVVIADVTAQEEASNRASFLAEATNLLTASFGAEDALAKLAHLAVPTLADWCFIDLIQENREAVRVAIAHTNPAREEWAWLAHRRLGDSVYLSPSGQELLRQGKPLLVPEVDEATLLSYARDPEHLQFLRQTGVCSAILLPMTARGQVVGNLMLLASESRRHFTADDLAFAAELARRVGLAVDNATLYRREQEAVRARDEFLAVASHDLRTPLAALHLSVEALERVGKANPRETVAEVLPRLDQMLRLLGRLAEMLSRLLDVSHIQAGLLAVDRSNLDLGQLVRETVLRMEPTLNAAHCQVVLQAPDGLVGAWDRVRLEQLLTNLLSNAAKYGAGHPVEITVEGDERSARLQVRDHGRGITPADQARLFSRFERVGDRSAIAGTGLGLWIARRIAEAHGGTIRVVSELGAGSTFIAELPRPSLTPTARPVPRPGEPKVAPGLH